FRRGGERDRRGILPGDARRIGHGDPDRDHRQRPADSLSGSDGDGGAVTRGEAQRTAREEDIGGAGWEGRLSSTASWTNGKRKPSTCGSSGKAGKRRPPCRPGSPSPSRGRSATA